MATTNATGGKTADVRVPATQTVKATAATAQAASKAVAKTPAAAPAVVVKINQAVAAPALPTYNAAGKTNTAAKAPEPVKTTPQPAAAAKAAQPAAAAKSPAPVAAAAAKPATPAPAVAAPAKAATPAPAAAAKSATPATAPAADGSLYVTGESSVKVDILASDSGYENKIFWSADNWKTRNYLGVDNHTASFDLGSFAKGTKIEFGIDNGQGDFFKTGGGNTDGFQHTRVSSNASSMTVGFEDLRGGGDQDFNDAIIRVGGLSNAQPVSAASPAPAPPVASKPEPAKPAPAPVVVKPEPAKPAPAPAKPVPAPVVAKPAPEPAKPAPAKPAPTPAKETKDNRSGLADGTNPGNGDGRVNSPNQGTQNPNQSTKTVVAPVTTAKTVSAKKV